MGCCRLQNRVQEQGTFKSTVLRKHSKLVSTVDGPLWTTSFTSWLSESSEYHKISLTQTQHVPLQLPVCSLSSDLSGSPSTRLRGTPVSLHTIVSTLSSRFSPAPLLVCAKCSLPLLTSSLWSDPCKLHLHDYVLCFACFI